MNMQEAMAIMHGPPQGFRVSFERRESGLLVSDFFPDRDEELIPTEDLAWTLAEAFADRTRGRMVNIYVIDSEWKAVSQHRELNPYHG